jgi:hypothetical protein
MNYNIQVYKLPKNNNLDIFIKTDKLVINSPYENHPLFTLGYHYFIGRTRESMSIIDKLDTKSEFYYVVNPFEAIIPNYDDSVNNLAKIYLKQEIQSLDFYKFWEMCLLFNIVEGTNLNIVLFKDYSKDYSKDINDGELQAIKTYRQKFLEKQSKKDNFYREYKKNITADLIIINNNLDKENIIIENLLKNIVDVLNCQNKKGNLILKLGDTYTMPTIKIIHLLTSLYKDCYLYKPFFSRSSDNEKYIICKNFDVNDVKKIIINLETIIKTIKLNYITDIFIDISQEILQDIFNTIKVINIKLVNQQQIIINDIIKYIKENNYYGDKYHEYRNQQIDATQWWITNFLPPSENLYKTNKETFEKNIKLTIEKNNLEKEKFINLLVT